MHADGILEQPRDSVKKATRIYLLVGLILFCGTVATVAVATIPWLDVGEHGFDKWDALLGLAIATTKASLVAAIFMHLNHEKRLVYVFITLGLIHLIGMGVGTTSDFFDSVRDRHFYSGDSPNAKSKPMFGPASGSPMPQEVPSVINSDTQQ